MLTRGAHPSTTVHYNGEYFDSAASHYYLHARHYDPVAGRFPTLDPYAGDIDNPLSFHKYGFVHGDPVQGIDPSGLMSLAEVSSAVATGLKMVGMVLANPVVRTALGAAYGYKRDGINGALAYGGAALALPAATAWAFNTVSLNVFLLLATNSVPAAAAFTAVEIMSTAVTVSLLLATSASSLTSDDPIEQVLGGVGLVGVAPTFIFGRAGLVFRALSPAIARLRLIQDIRVSSTPPPEKALNRPIGKSATQNAALQKYIEEMQAMGAVDIRVNQQQINAAKQRVGINRPDLQYTLKGKRYYVEFDSRTSDRGLSHEYRLLANDPKGHVILLRQN